MARLPMSATIYPGRSSASPSSAPSSTRKIAPPRSQPKRSATGSLRILSLVPKSRTVTAPPRPCRAPGYCGEHRKASRLTTLNAYAKPGQGDEEARERLNPPVQSRQPLPAQSKPFRSPTATTGLPLEYCACKPGRNDQRYAAFVLKRHTQDLSKDNP